MLGKKRTHSFHLVDPSPWPFFASIGALALTVGGVLFLHDIGGSVLFLGGFVYLLYVLILWWTDVIREGTFQGHHTFKVQRGLRLGVILFIVSEVMFFFAFFWAFFHSSLAPTVAIGCQWPPKGIITFSPFGIPLLNTIILLTSGATITFAHYCLIGSDRKLTIIGLITTISFAILFTLLQIYEYIEAPFDISDGVYGSVFFMSTGFHGFHVIIGTIFIIVTLIRYIFYHFNEKQHFGFEASAWYWHFVDVVWIFLYVCIYFWGNL